MGFIEKIMSSFSKSTAVEKEFELIGNCFGFFSLQGGLGTSTLCLELAKSISDQGVHTCIVDCNPLSTFYLSKAMPFLKIDEDNLNIPSISTRLQKRNSPIVDSLIQITPTLKVLCFGDMQYADTFDLDESILDETFQELKSSFDLVIMDIPNIPWLETTLTSLEVCSTVYTICGFTGDTVLRKLKADNFMSLAGKDTMLNNLIIANVPQGFSLKKMIESKTGCEVLLEIPHIPLLSKTSLSSTFSLGSIKGKEAVRYAGVLDFFSSEILNGISNKNKDKEVTE